MAKCYNQKNSSIDGKRTMILVEIKVPALGKTWDAQVEEQETAGKIIKVLVETLGERETELEKYALVWLERQRILSKEISLQHYGVQDGDTLLLV